MNKKESIRNYVKTPLIAVDCIIEYENKFVIINRKNPPKNYAFPGGFVEIGEKLLDAVKREIKEETNLEISNIKQLDIYDDPKRDRRDHIITVVYYAEGKGKLKAGDDAKETLLLTKDEIKNTKLII